MVDENRKNDYVVLTGSLELYIGTHCMPFLRLDIGNTVQYCQISFFNSLKY